MTTAREGSDERLARLVRSLVPALNDGMASVSASLGSQHEVIRAQNDLITQLSNEKVTAARRIAELEQRDRERDVLMGHVDVLRERSKADAARKDRLFKLAEDSFANIGKAMTTLPPGRGTAPPTLRQLGMMLFSKLSAETKERIREEVPEDLAAAFFSALLAEEESHGGSRTHQHVQ